VNDRDIDSREYLHVRAAQRKYTGMTDRERRHSSEITVDLWDVHATAITTTGYQKKNIKTNCIT